MSVVIELARREDAEEILALQKLAFSRFPHYLPPQRQTLDDLRQQMTTDVVLKATQATAVVASVRAAVSDGTCEIKRLIVHPQSQRQGLARKLMVELEQRFASVARFELYTGIENEQSYALYTKLGYRELRREVKDDDAVVYMEKRTR